MPKDWIDWEHELLLQADTYPLRKHNIDKVPIQREPTMSDIRKKKYMENTAAASRNSRSQDENTIQETQYEKWWMTDLTDAGQKAFNLDFNWSKQEETTYSTQKTTIENFNKWIFQTVAPTCKTTCCEPGHPY